MRRRVRQVEEEGSLLTRELLNALDRSLGEGVRRVVVLWELGDSLGAVTEDAHPAALEAGVRLRWIKEITATIKEPI